MSVLKMHQSRQLCQEQTATQSLCKWIQGNQSSSSNSSSPHTTVLPPPHTKQPQTVTDQGSNVRNLLVRSSFGAENSVPFFHIWPIHAKVGRKRISHSWDRGFGQRNTKAGFSLGFVLHVEMSGCSVLVCRKSSLIQDVLMVAPHRLLPLCLGLTAAALSFLLFSA